MKWLPIALLLLYSLTVYAGNIEQRTTGWCSPAVADTQGNVTIECYGVDPRALHRLNELLDKKDLELQEKLQEAEEWARKYRELEQRLAAESKENELARQAEILLKAGRLEKAGAILDRLLESGEREIDRIASYQYSRAQIYALEFKPLKALPHYAKAFQYRPENPEYAFAYANVLQEQHVYRESEPIYRKVLTYYRQLAHENPSAYLPYVATTLNNLAILYWHTQRLKPAEQAFQEALGTYRQLALDNPSAYLPYVAGTLNNLANLYRHTQRLEPAEQAYQEALGTYRQLAQENPSAYRPYVANTLNNLAILYQRTQRLEPAEQAYLEALGIRRQLAQDNPSAYRQVLAKTLINLARLYGETKRQEKAVQTFQEAVALFGGVDALREALE